MRHRRWFRVRGLLLLGLHGLVAQAQPATPDPAPPPMRAVQVSPHAWYVQGVSAIGSKANGNFIANAGFVVTPAGVVVFDALGSPALARQLLAEIGRVTDRPVTHVIVSHYHADHVYGLQVFKAAGATLVAERRGREPLGSEPARQRLQGSIAEGLTEAGTRLQGADVWIDGSASVEVGGVRLELLHLGPAHSAEDLGLFLPDEGVLFAGDLVFRARLPFVGQGDSRRWIASLDALLQRPIRTIVPGHGPHSTTAAADLRLTRDYLAHLRAALGPSAKALVPFEEAYAAVDWSRFAAVPLFQAANRINAYNTYLRMELESD